MRWLINYLRSCFCKHDWEMIFDLYYHWYQWRGSKYDKGLSMQKVRY